VNYSNFKIIKQDGTTYDMEELGIVINSFNPLSPEYSSHTETIPYRDGFLDYGGQYNGRTIEIEGSFISNSSLDYRQRRNEVFRLFNSKEWFYVINDAEPIKRWKVRTEGSYNLKRVAQVMGSFTIGLVSDSAYAESIGTTLNPPEHGQMLQVEEQSFSDPPVQYEFDTSSFSVWNDGDVDIDPRERYLKITFYGDVESDVSIKNLTTGDEWILYGELFSYETIELEGIRFRKDGLSIFGNTNRKLITLAKGINDFEITGATNFQISFDFRFYYL